MLFMPVPDSLTRPRPAQRHWQGIAGKEAMSNLTHFQRELRGWVSKVSVHDKSCRKVKLQWLLALCIRGSRMSPLAVAHSFPSHA